MTKLHKMRLAKILNLKNNYVNNFYCLCVVYKRGEAEFFFGLVVSVAHFAFKKTGL